MNVKTAQSTTVTPFLVYVLTLLVVSSALVLMDLVVMGLTWNKGEVDATLYLRGAEQEIGEE